MSPMEKEKLNEVLNSLGLDEKMYLLSTIPTHMIIAEINRRFEEMSDTIERVRKVMDES